MKIKSIIKGVLDLKDLICLFIADKFDKKIYTEFDIPKLSIVKDEKFDTYIGRPNKWLGLEGSIWGNPFPVDSEGNHIKFKERMRIDVLNSHMEYLRNNKVLLLNLKSLSGKKLGCYCYSSDKKCGRWCHGHNLIQLYKERVLKYPISKLDYNSQISD